MPRASSSGTIGTQHAGPAQYVRRRRTLGHGNAELFGQRAQLLQHLDVASGWVPRGRQRIESALDLTFPRRSLPTTISRSPGFERAQFFGRRNCRSR